MQDSGSCDSGFESQCPDTAKMKSKRMTHTVFVLAVFALLPQQLFASQTFLNAGFVSGIWFSKFPFFAGEHIRVYAAVQNQSEFDLVGKVQFFDGETLTGEKNFSALQGRLIEQWMDWRVSSGEHRLYVRMAEVLASKPGEEARPITLQFDTSETKVFVVDRDTDGDGVGDADDQDDDNDGISDERELQLGSDPLSPDTRPSQAGEPHAQRNVAEEIAGKLVQETERFLDRIVRRLEEKKTELESAIEEESKSVSVEGEGQGSSREKTVYLWLIQAALRILATWWLTVFAGIMLVITLWKVWKAIHR